MNHELAHRHLASTHPRMAALIARSLPYNVKPARSIRPFDALAESIAYQQLSGKAAATIFGRVRALYPRRKYLDPEKILATPDEAFRAAGLSRNKIAALKDLAAKTIDGTVPSSRAIIRMSDEEIVARLIAVRGIGRWAQVVRIAHVHLLLGRRGPVPRRVAGHHRRDVREMAVELRRGGAPGLAGPLRDARLGRC